MQLSLSIQKFNKKVFSLSDESFLNIQRLLSKSLFFLFGPIISFVVFRYYGIKVDNLKSIRKRYKEILKEGEGPLIICSNHLTRVDSFVQSACLGSVWDYWFNYQSLPWNLPEKTKFYHKWYFRVICYLGKCIPVLRGAPSSEGKRTLNKMLHVLSKGDVLAIFPEGKRSRTGFVDTEDFSYGVGQLLTNCKDARILCIYLRGKKEGGFADFPVKGEEFYFKMEVVSPKSDLKGLRQTRDYSTQIITKLHSMEKEYLTSEES